PGFVLTNGPGPPRPPGGVDLTEMTSNRGAGADGDCALMTADVASIVKSARATFDICGRRPGGVSVTANDRYCMEDTIWIRACGTNLSPGRALLLQVRSSLQLYRQAQPSTPSG